MGDGALNMRQNVAAKRSFANPAAQGGCSPVSVSHSYPEQVISRNTRGGGGWMITASPLCWFLQHAHSSETCIARNKSLPHYAPSVGLFRAPTLVLAMEDYLFFPEIPLRYRLLVWFAQKEKISVSYFKNNFLVCTTIYITELPKKVISAMSGWDLNL